MNHAVDMSVTACDPRAVRRAKPARIPKVHEVGPFVAHGDRPMYASDEGLS